MESPPDYGNAIYSLLEEGKHCIDSGGVRGMTVVAIMKNWTNVELQPYKVTLQPY
jgi:hypothetical protein